MKKLTPLRALWLSSVIFGSGSAALAADLGGSLKDSAPPAPATPVSPWQLSFTTYGWLTWIKGDVTIKGRPLSIDVSPKDVLNALDWSQIPVWMSYFEARNGRLSLFNDIVYAKLEGSARFAKAAQGRFVSVSLAGRVEADYEQAVVEFGAGYEVWSSGTAAGFAALDVLGGGRYWHQDVSVSADLAATLAIAGPGGVIDLEVSGNRVVARSRSIDWIDPFVGARFRYQLAPGQTFSLRGDVGGFGVGSDFSWQTIATFNWRLIQRPTHSFDAYLGYRALSVDYSKGMYRYDATQHGPVLGGTLQF
jgi:hypothetical protein